MGMTNRDWVGERAGHLVHCLGERGLTVETNEAREIISQRVLALSEGMGISTVTARDYVTDGAIGAIADTLAGLLADEAPGVDLMEAPRSVLLSQKLIGSGVAGLAEAILFHVRQHHDRPGSRDEIRELAEHLSMLGAFIAESPKASVPLPPAMVTRIAARMDEAASQSDVPAELGAAWRRDAMRLRGSV